MKENSTNSQNSTENVQTDRVQTVLVAGEWKGGVPWQFIVTKSHEAPPLPELCTAAFCIVTYQNKILLIKHANRGFEFPGGHINPEEDLLATIKREVLEEAGAVIPQPTFFGYKKVSPQTPIAHRDKPETFYPFPHSYVPYYHSEARELFPVERNQEIHEILLATWTEAEKLLAPGHSHQVILQHLIASGAITVK